MAQEKARATRARAKKDESKAVAATAKATRPRARRSKKGASAEELATYAYLLWERGEPGDELEHWLRAERELAA